MKSKITVVGIGPGSKEYLTPKALEKIKEAQILVGSKKMLSLFNGYKKEVHVLNHSRDNKFALLFDFLKNNYKNKKLAVLVSGDTGMYSLAKLLRKSFNENVLEFIPGISSVSLFFAKIGKTYEDVKIVSVHGRDDYFLKDVIKKDKKICILTDSKNDIAKISSILDEYNVDGIAWIGSDLSYPDEAVVKASINKLAKQSKKSDNTILYLELD